MTLAVSRPALESSIRTALSRSPAVALVGPRQVGKTTLARALLRPESPNYFDLEDPVDLERLSTPMTALGALEGLVVIDEVQRRPDLFPMLRVLIDRAGGAGQYLLLGSASPALLRQSSESLAGRLEIVDIDGFALSETGIDQLDRLWTRGGFPRSFLGASEEDSLAWREAFVRLTVERDLPNLGLGAPPELIRRLWAMLAHYHGQVMNASDIARSLAISEASVRRYVDFLAGALLVRPLQPWFENLAKRQVKTPKIYVRDSGLLHALLHIGSHSALLQHPKLGASWEGFMLEQILWHARPSEAYFWATHQGAELDLLMLKHGRRVGVEFKRTDAPKLTPSMKIAMQDLRLDALLAVYPGTKSYGLAENVLAVPARDVATFVG